MLPRILELELMDTPEDAREYDSMDHAAVNELFVSDLLRALSDWSLTWAEPSRSQRPVLHVLDLGAGTAQIPIELARRAPHIHITAADASQSMLALARRNIAACGLANRIEPLLADAKNLPFNNATFDAVISNSIVHHIPSPREAIAAAIRVTAANGFLFHRDLARPYNDKVLNQIVTTYAADTTPYQRKLFTDSLHAALTVDEMRALITAFGFAPDTVQMTSDRHWTWLARKL